MKLVEITLQLAVRDGADWEKQLAKAIAESDGILAAETKGGAKAAPEEKAKRKYTRHAAKDAGRPKRKYTRRAPKPVDSFYGQPQGTTRVKDNGDGTVTEMRK